MLHPRLPRERPSFTQIRNLRDFLKSWLNVYPELG